MFNFFKKLKEKIKDTPKVNNREDNILEKFEQSENEGRRWGNALKKEENLKAFRTVLGNSIEEFKDTTFDMDEIKALAEKHPDRLIFQDVQNSEEYRARQVALGYSLKGEFEKAIEYADEGLKLNSKSAYLFYMKGRSEGDIGEYKEGIKDLTKAIQLNSKDADTFIERGHIKQKIGDKKGAKEDYNQAKKINPHITLPEEKNPVYDRWIKAKIAVCTTSNGVEDHKKWLEKLGKDIYWSVDVDKKPHMLEDGRKIFEVRLIPTSELASPQEIGTKLGKINQITTTIALKVDSTLKGLPIEIGFTDLTKLKKPTDLLLEYSLGKTFYMEAKVIDILDLEKRDKVASQVIFGGLISDFLNNIKEKTEREKYRKKIEELNDKKK